MKRILIAFLLFAAFAAAQEKKADESPREAPKIVQKLFILKYADPSQVENLLRVFSATVTTNREMHAMTISAGPESMAGVEDAIKRLDVPSAASKNIELTAYLVLADGGEQTGALPKDLENVTAQLRNAFAFKSYGLLDVISLHMNDMRNGRQSQATSSGGALTINGRPHPVVSELTINSIRVGGDGNTISIDNLTLLCRIPEAQGDANVTTRNLNLQTSLDMKEGQKVVVGRMGVNQGQALFLVLIAKIL